MPKLQVYLDSVGYWRWRLVAANGEKVAASEAYSSKSAALHAAERVKTIAWTATIVVIS